MIFSVTDSVYERSTAKQYHYYLFCCES